MLRLNTLSGFGAAAAGGLDVADVFSTDLYTGNGATGQSITNGIDLSGEGGLVWLKNRDSPNSHALYDTERGDHHLLASDTSAAEVDVDPDGVTSFNSDGYSITGTGGSYGNRDTNDHVGWTFRKAAGFFDVVTYTGNVTNRAISHNLGSEPGMIIVKNTADAENWIVYHRSNTGAPETDYLLLDATNATADDSGVWNDTAPTSTEFTVGTYESVNGSSDTMVAYLFGHDPDGIIQCGSYTGNGSSSGPSIRSWVGASIP